MKHKFQLSKPQFWGYFQVLKEMEGFLVVGEVVTFLGTHKVPTLYLERHAVPYEGVAGDERTGARPEPRELLPAAGDLG